MRKPIAGWASRHPVVALLHEQTVNAHIDPDAGEGARDSKAYARMPRVLLPSPEPISGSLESALASRCSATAMDSSRPLPLSALGTLLHWSAGRRQRVDSRRNESRYFPSAGALYPLDVYVVARAVAGLPRSLYHWHDAAHALERLPTPVEAVGRIYEALRFPWHKDAAAVIVVTARPQRTLASYGARGYRFILIETGAVLQNLGLVAAALGIAGSPVGTNLDRAVEEMLALDPDEELFLTAFAVGIPGVTAPSQQECRDIIATARRGTAVAATAVVTVAQGVPAKTLALLPLWDAPSQVPGLSTLAAVEQVLGTRLIAELPAELHAVPPELWDVYRTLRRFTQSGVPTTWGTMKPRPDEPRFHGYRVMLGTVDAGAGTDVSSGALALTKAASEAVERFVWCERPPAATRLRVAKPGDLGSAGLDLDTLAGYSKDLRARHAARLAWSATTPFTWVAGRSLTDGIEKWVPLQIVSSAGPEPRGTAAREPELRPRVTTGVAAHPDRTSAIVNGLCEVIERDAAMLAWLARRPGEALDGRHTDDAGLAEIVRRFEDARFSCSIARLPGDAPIPVVVAALRDSSGVGPALAVGTCAAPSVTAAAQKALLEALMVWRLVRGMRDDGIVAPSTLEGLDQRSRLLWWSEPSRWDELHWLFEGPPACVTPSRIREAGEELETLLAWFRSMGQVVIAVDLTDDATVQQLGHHVVATVVPEFHPMHLHEPWPALWSRRLDRVASGPRTVVPHPFP
jgi:thiazole/oxazole-forming peptide maturase SagD family component